MDKKRYVVLIFGNSWTWWEHYILREEDSMYFSFLEIRENHVVLIFGYSWNPRTIDLFLRPKMCSREVFFCFPVQNLYWQVRFATNQKPKASRVTSGYGELMIPFDSDPSELKNGAFIQRCSIKKCRILGLKSSFFCLKSSFFGNGPFLLLSWLDTQ